MNNIFVVFDKTNRKIYLTKERYKHIMKHPGMHDKLGYIKETLQSPTKILQSNANRNTHFYFRYYKDRREYLFVSVRYLNSKGFIITSFYTDRIK